MRHYESEGQQSVCGHTNTGRWCRRSADGTGAGPQHTSRLFPWVGIAQALIFTQGGLSTQPDLPAGWPIIFCWIFTGHRLSCLTPKDHSTMQWGLPGRGPGGAALPQISEDEGVGPAPPCGVQGLAVLGTWCERLNVESGIRTGADGADT